MTAVKTEAPTPASPRPDGPEGRRSHPDPVDVYVGRRLRKQRVLLRLSQEQLARAVGVTFQQIQKYERGANRISASRLFDIAKVLGVPISFFFDHIDDDIAGRADAHIPGVAEPTPPPLDGAPSMPSEQLDLIAAYWRLPSDDIRRKALALLRSMAGLKDKKGEPLPDAE
ncbi:helix-turn-helix domain-containing protein [Roseospira marina]|uniref:helix-turn-helix domain-containing protein n=1 Tax=Roseospira marina TaxID=140057 RepID=UPI0017FB519B|nr:helix-turn-helix domain-containing protein [Roseospira marina]MBB4313731.1 transcriptional regulator with XRE-family HTH domain [Roseospira marina]MBB5086893.1 transcriptional regulator with XRE-family HTH domain [Roseospira marina]